MSDSLQIGGSTIRIKSGIMFVGSATVGEQLAKGGVFANPHPGELENFGEVAKWGSNNLLPNEMAADIEATGVLSAGIDAKVRIALGKGPMPAKIIGYNDDGYEVLEFVNDPEIMDWLEGTNAYKQSYDSMKDLYGLGNAFQQTLFTPDRKYMLAYKRQDACECRFQTIKDRNPIAHVWMSGDWKQYSSMNPDMSDKHFDKVPLLNRDFPLFDLQSRTSGSTFMLALQYNLTGRHYYAPSPWYSAKKWVKIAQGIPTMKEAMVNNQMTIKYMVDIHPGFWNTYDRKYDSYSLDEKQRVQDDFFDRVEQYLVGGDNAYKSMFNTMVLDTATASMVPAIKITPIADNTRDGKMVIDSASANMEILLPLMINSALLGVDFPGSGAGGGAGSGSDIREAYLVQVMLQEMERKQNNTVFDIAKKVNGWSQRIPNLVFRYPNQILTTLNTGKNTQTTS